MRKLKFGMIVTLLFSLTIVFLTPANCHAQTGLKKVRMGSSSTNVSFLALYTALSRGFFKDEGIDLEIIYMPANLASTAVMNGDIDYNGAVTGTIGAAVRGQPMKVLLFTVAKPFLFLMSKKTSKTSSNSKEKDRRQFAGRVGDPHSGKSSETLRPGAGAGCFASSHGRVGSGPVRGA